MIKIGEFSKLSNITVRSLRHYESLGILEPEKTDPATGYRYYSAVQLETANKIRMFREVGFSLDTIKGLLKADNLDTIRQYYDLRQMELEEEIRSIKERKERLRLLLEGIEENRNIERLFQNFSFETASFKNRGFVGRKAEKPHEPVTKQPVLEQALDCCNVTEKNIPQKTILHIRRILPSYDYVKTFWTEFFAEVTSLGLTPKEPFFLRSLCLDKEYKEHEIP